MSDAVMSLTHMRLQLDESGVAEVVLDRADDKLNTLDPALMEDFQTVLERLESDAGIRAVIITSAKSNGFVAGANIRWFSTLDADTAQEAITAGQELYGRLERLHTHRGKPVVAAIHGACLGGGCELALACSHRVASNDPSTSLGQPEVQLGLIPAAGATQRLPRLVGIATALDLILSGKNVDANRARKMGLVDEVAAPPILAQVAHRMATDAIGAARPAGPRRRHRLPDRLQQAALESNPIGRSLLFAQARRRLLDRTGGHYPAPECALEAVRIGTVEGIEAGLRAEARYFAELVVSVESQALRSVFFATRSRPDDNGARRVNMVGIVGGGLMGGGIAAVTAQKAGTRVRVKEVDPEGVARARAYVARVLRDRVRRRRMSEFEAEQAALRVTGGTDWAGFAGADLIIEAVFEDLDLKRRILEEAEGIVGAETVFASNTSSIPIRSIASAAKRPERVLGMHYFSPVEKMPLLEIVVTSATAPWAEVTAAAFGRRQGKNVIVVNDGTGFYTSRILGPYTAEALQLLTEGATVEEIDSAIEDWGFPVGPLRLADEVGLDVGAKIAPILVEAFGDRMAGPDVMRRLIESDRRGRKNHRGFYSYDSEGKRGGVDPTVYDDLGLQPLSGLDRRLIQDRLTLAMINEAARCLEEGILRSASDGDLGAVLGLGFPPFRGGPFFWVDHLGAEAVVQRLRDLEAEHGSRFTPADILVKAAESGERFRQLSPSEAGGRDPAQPGRG